LSNQIKLHCLTTVMKQVHTTYINHARWHRCLRLCGLPCVFGGVFIFR